LAASEFRQGVGDGHFAVPPVLDGAPLLTHQVVQLAFTDREIVCVERLTELSAARQDGRLL